MPKARDHNFKSPLRKLKEELLGKHSSSSSSFTSISSHQHADPTDIFSDAFNVDDNQLRRPMNAFLLFCKRHRHVVRSRHPWLDNRACTKMLADMWGALDGEEKEKYLQLARECKAAFMKAHPDYRWSGPNRHAGKVTNPGGIVSRNQTQGKGDDDDGDEDGEGNKGNSSGITIGKLADPSQMGGLSLLLLAGQQDPNTKNPTPTAPGHKTTSSQEPVASQGPQPTAPGPETITQEPIPSDGQPKIDKNPKPSVADPRTTVQEPLPQHGQPKPFRRSNSVPARGTTGKPSPDLDDDGIKSTLFQFAEMCSDQLAIKPETNPLVLDSKSDTSSLSTELETETAKMNNNTITPNSTKHNSVTSLSCPKTSKKLSPKKKLQSKKLKIKSKTSPRDKENNLADEKSAETVNDRADVACRMKTEGKEELDEEARQTNLDVKLSTAAEGLTKIKSVSKKKRKVEKKNSKKKKKKKKNGGKSDNKQKVSIKSDDTDNDDNEETKDVLSLSWPGALKVRKTKRKVDEETIHNGDDGEHRNVSNKIGNKKKKKLNDEAEDHDSGDGCNGNHRLGNKRKKKKKIDDGDENSDVCNMKGTKTLKRGVDKGVGVGQDSGQKSDEGNPGRRKSRRSCKGQLYRKLVDQGMLESLQRPERPFNCKKAWRHTSEGMSGFSEAEDEVFEPDDDRPRKGGMKRWRSRKRTSSGSSFSVSDFDYGEINVEARLATLPQYAPEQFRTKRKAILKAKKSSDVYKDAKFVKTTGKAKMKPVRTVSASDVTKNLSGSQKRKASKSSIMHLTPSRDSPSIITSIVSTLSPTPNPDEHNQTNGTVVEAVKAAKITKRALSDPQSFTLSDLAEVASMELKPCSSSIPSNTTSSVVGRSNLCLSAVKVS